LSFCHESPKRIRVYFSSPNSTHERIIHNQVNIILSTTAFLNSQRSSFHFTFRHHHEIYLGATKCGSNIAYILYTWSEYILYVIHYQPSVTVINYFIHIAKPVYIQTRQPEYVSVLPITKTKLSAVMTEMLQRISFQFQPFIVYTQPHCSICRFTGLRNIFIFRPLQKYVDDDDDDERIIPMYP